MSEHSNPSHGSKGRLLRVPPQKGLWLFDHDQVKYRTPFQQTASAILGCLALGYAVSALLVMWSSKSGTWMSLLFLVAALAYGLTNAPVGIIYWIRRGRGEITECFDHEVESGGRDSGSRGANHAPDHR